MSISKKKASHNSDNLSSSSSSFNLHISCDSYQHELFQTLFKFKNDNLFTDICIYVEGVEFKCHKVILCASSSYFKAMFSCDLKESRLGKVFIENISPWTMKRVLDFIYSGKIEINYDNVIDIVNASIMLDLYVLTENCSAYLQEHIDAANCVDLYLFADMHNFATLKEKSFGFLLENLSNVHADSADYVKLGEATFIDLIKSDSLNIRKEIDVFHIIIKWISHAPGERKASSESLFNLLRYDSFTIDELNEIQAEKLVCENERLSAFIKSIVDKKRKNKILTNDTNLIKMQSRPSTLPRDFLGCINTNYFQIYDFFKSKWTEHAEEWPLTSDRSEIRLNESQMSPLGRKFIAFSIAVLNNTLYLTGGALVNSSTNETAANNRLQLLDCCLKWDSLMNKWCTLSPLLTPRAFHTSLALESLGNTTTSSNCLFILYGIVPHQPPSDDHFNFIQCQTIDYFNADTDSWSQLQISNSLLKHHLFQSSQRLDLASYLAHRKSIVSLRNMIYILNDNCIHCYEFGESSSSQLSCLPYFRLPDHLNDFILIGAISTATQQLVMANASVNGMDENKSTGMHHAKNSSMFSWLSTEHELDSPNQFDDDNGAGDVQVKLIKYEVVIYLLNIDKRQIYEFYPARNKLKKLPNLLLKHSLNETYIIRRGSKLYLTGGLKEVSENELADNSTFFIEEFDSESNSWSLFIETKESVNDKYFLSNNLEFNMSNIFFKLRISFH